MKRIPLSEPCLGRYEARYLRSCLRTNWISSAGPFVSKFERRVARVAGREFGVSTCSGTAALHIAYMLAGVQPEDEVILPSLTFIAPANAVRYLGAWPVFLDVDSRSWQIDPVQVHRFLNEGCERDARGRLINRVTGRVVKCLSPVHILGHPCPMDILMALASEYGLTVVEDATESLGASYQGIPVGSHSQLACFSFNGNKIITTGGGGMLVTDDSQLSERARYLTTQAKDDPIEYIHNEIGYNYRLTSLQASFGLGQLKQLRSFVRLKRGFRRTYQEGLTGLPGISFQEEAEGAKSTFWLTTILIDPSRRGRDRKFVMNSLQERAIETRPLWQPLHQSPAHRGSYFLPCPTTERIHAQALSLPSSCSMTTEEQQRCMAALRQLID